MGDKNAPDINEQNISKEVVIMEVNKQVLETLYFVCQVRLPFPHLSIGSLHACVG